LPNEQLHDPHAAVYVALLLLDNNEADAAREFVEEAQKGPLFVEEKKLLDEAFAKLAAPSPPRETAPTAASPLDGVTMALPRPAASPKASPVLSPRPGSSAVEPPGATPVVHPLLRDRP
jgi:hypothetical protein